ncbi:transposase [Erwinia piriflorinigrans CFBP 5888]|uniref:Transposase n=1 Tax=Erwinia piriflorinigrans CFBP 5888 TaxID=1161919 RepID=V5ZCD9_9GAMM|nr:transposase [Erwinia piriflorinigrans CFBP 5888]
MTHKLRRDPGVFTVFQEAVNEMMSLPVFDMFIPKLETGQLCRIKKLKVLAAELAKGLKTETDLNQLSRVLTKLSIETAPNGQLTDRLKHERNAPKNKPESPCWPPAGIDLKNPRWLSRVFIRWKRFSLMLGQR